jgi:hypothetical protein
MPDARKGDEIMMDGMMGMGVGMLIWGIVGILLIVVLVMLIIKLSKR